MAGPLTQESQLSVSESASSFFRVGFTGCKNPTDGQVEALEWLLRAWRERILEFHHGDCVGSDVSAHAAAWRIGIPIVIHPPTYPGFRAYCMRRMGGIFVKELPQRGYMVRNVRIIAETDVLIAFPKCEEILKSGTWSAIRSARRQNKPRIIVYPDGYVDPARPPGSAIPMGRP